KQEAVHTEGGVNQQFDEAKAKRIRRKIDFRLLPLLILLYTLAFLDRVNIGNARLWHMERDLQMEGWDYNIAVLGGLARRRHFMHLAQVLTPLVSSLLYSVHLARRSVKHGSFPSEASLLDWRPDFLLGS